MRRIMTAIIFAALLVSALPARAGQWIQDSSGRLRLRLDTGGRCAIDAIEVNGRQVLGRGGAFTGALSGWWQTSRRLISSPKVATEEGRVIVSGIRYGFGPAAVEESWTFTPQAESIRWRIDRTYTGGGRLKDVSLPAFRFDSMSTWTAALLDTGGVAWPKLLDAPNASYATHAGAATFYNAGTNDALRVAVLPGSAQNAIRFTREPGGAFTANFTATNESRRPADDLRLFRRRQDVWGPFNNQPGKVTVELSLTALSYDQVSPIGDLKGIDSGAVREILNTIGRIGVIDRGLVASNGWYSGNICLHEPWFALMGLPLQDPSYFQNLVESFDTYREKAVTPEGRVKSRWAYDAGDSIPGTYDANGFYEAQWGILLDSQPSYVQNVADIFEIEGDREWARGQRETCRRVLDYTLARDSNGNGLVEVMTDSHAAARGSDWIDVIWAAFENGLVNAEMYQALRSWARVEEVLGDPAAAERYRSAAARIRETFNRPIGEGGLWDPEHGCYAYWRDADGSVHGRNFVTPVNFLAISTGLCDDPVRIGVILDRLEERMTAEGLFFWPLCLDSYQREEVYQPVNWPFPRYENGDIFLAWGQVGVQAYALHQPGIALKYIRNLLARYRQDGLAFQRYSRQNQRGVGADILANNMLPVAGLYHDLYGIQPRHDRLLLDPRLPAELAGTRLVYNLRGVAYRLTLDPGRVEVGRGAFVVVAAPPVAVAAERPDTIEIFEPAGADGESRRSVSCFLRQAGPQARITIEVKSFRPRMEWTVAAPNGELPEGDRLSFRVAGLKPGAQYLVAIGQAKSSLAADGTGAFSFASPLRAGQSQEIRIEP